MNDDEVYLKHRDALIRYATVLRGPFEAEDVVSAVVTRLYEARRGLSDIEDPRPYLMRAVLNEALNRRRRQPHLVLPDVAVDAHHGNPDVLEAVRSLPVRQRAAIYWCYWCELTSAEAAEVMGCRPATVRRYLHLARRRLERTLR